MNAMNTINQVFCGISSFKRKNPKPVFYSVHPHYSVHPLQVLSSASRTSTIFYPPNYDSDLSGEKVDAVMLVYGALQMAVLLSIRKTLTAQM